jgi:hypothetical protein
MNRHAVDAVMASKRHPPFARKGRRKKTEIQPKPSHSGPNLCCKIPAKIEIDLLMEKPNPHARHG